MEADDNDGDGGSAEEDGELVMEMDEDRASESDLEDVHSIADEVNTRIQGYCLLIGRRIAVSVEAYTVVVFFPKFSFYISRLQLIYIL